jgi:hypothetical protein
VSNQSASKTLDAFFVLQVLLLPKRPTLVLKFWFYHFQDAGCFFGNSGSANQRCQMLFLEFWFSQSETLGAFSVILVQPITFLYFWFSHFQDAGRFLCNSGLAN